MKNFLIGLVTGVVFCGLALLLLFLIMARVAGSFGDRPAQVADGSTLIFKLEGEVPEKPTPEIPLPFFEQQAPITVAQVWEAFHKAAADPRVKGVIFEPRGLVVGWAKLEEIREQIQQFRKSGKPIVSFLRSPGTKEYYLATATDRIYMFPEDLLDLKGLRVEALYLKNTLDKLGVKMDVIHAGKYKDAGDVFTQTAMSPETREVLNNILDQYYGDLLTVVAAGRKKQREQVAALIDQGPFMGKQALAAGLVDVLGYEDQVAVDMQKRLNQTALRKLSIKEYVKAPAAAGGIPKRIALLVGEGEITRGPANDDFGGGEGITSGGFIKLLKQVEADSSIKGVILRINSPGGDGVASDDILHEARNLSKKKPVVISMSDLAASGGYFIAMTGDPIVAYPNTLTGSIGVVFAKPNLHGLYDKIGVTKDLLTRGRFAALDSDYAPMTPDEQQKLRQEIDQFYRVFVSRVADGRKRGYDQVEPLAQGRVWLGQQAKQNGLVDHLGGLDRAVELVRQRANIAASDKVTLVAYPPKRSVVEMLFNRNNDSAGIEVKTIRKLAGGVPFQSWIDGGFLKAMPFAIQVH